MTEELIKRYSPTEDDFVQIRRLAKRCHQQDGVDVKLNWDLISHRDPALVSDFCYYCDDQLVGYVPLDGFSEEYEITGIVQPEFRRRGIFSRLMNEARAEANRRGAKRLLLVNYKHSASGTDMAKAFALPYQFSEYRMHADRDSMPALPASDLQLVEVTENDLTELSRLLSIAFGNGSWSSVDNLHAQFHRKDGQYWFARLNGETIGQIGAIGEDSGIYIRAVGIVPEYRGKGYGRQLLAALIQQLMAGEHQHFELDVNARNSSALSLYESCGFHEANVYDYYEVTLQP